MQNLKNIEANYNEHVNVYYHAYDSNDDYAAVYEKGYLNAVEHVLQQLGVNYQIDLFGHITIKQEVE